MKRVFLLLLFMNLCHLYSEVRLTLYNSNTQPERIAVVRYLLDAFELYNPGMRIDLVDYSDDESIDLLFEKDEPDIILADTRLLNRLNRRGFLDNRQMEVLIDRLGRDDFYNGALNIGIPYSAWLQVLWYRKDWFERDKLIPPSTISNIQKAAGFYTGMGRYGIILGSVNETYTEQCFLHLAAANGLTLEDNNSEPWIDGDILYKNLTMYKSLQLASPKIENSWRSRDYYMQQRSAMLFYSTHLMDDLAIREISLNSLTSKHCPGLDGTEYDPNLIKNTGMITTITGEKSVSYGSVSGFGLFKSNDKERDRAKELLIEFLFRDDVYITWLHMSPGGMLPVKRSILENDNFFRDPAGVFRRFGRDRIIELTNGIDNLTIINLEELAIHNDYTENGLQKLVYNWINEEYTKSDLHYNWIKGN